ncbi:MAG TPA: hypothetical protein VMB50_17655 [Myxococcales bacterium]|nr:hypothetical protein [Myxococcales bacterium]
MALALSLAASGSARADALDAAKRFYHEFEYDSARVELLRAAELPDPHRRAEAYLYLGLVDAIQGDDAGTLQNFRLGLALDPGLRLPSGLSPKITAVFERVRADVGAVPEPHAGPPSPAPPPLEPPVAAPAPPAPTAPRSPPTEARSPTAATSSATEAVPSAVAGPAPRASHRGRWAAGALVVVGVAAASTALYFALQEAAAERSFHSATWQTDAAGFQSSANQDALAADILYASGAVLGLTGVGLWFAF